MPTRPAILAADLRFIVGQLKRRLREQASPGDLSWAQIAVLGRLEREGPATVTTLARAEGVRPQSMGATIAPLEQAGLITGTPDLADGRQTILSLTPAARDIVQSNRANIEHWLARAIEIHLSEAEQSQLESTLILLKRLL